jgi:hypothetical protein
MDETETYEAGVEFNELVNTLDKTDLLKLINELEDELHDVLKDFPSNAEMEFLRKRVVTLYKEIVFKKIERWNKEFVTKDTVDTVDTIDTKDNSNNCLDTLAHNEYSKT